MQQGDAGWDGERPVDAKRAVSAEATPAPADALSSAAVAHVASVLTARVGMPVRTIGRHSLPGTMPGRPRLAASPCLGRARHGARPWYGFYAERLTML
jgi:hypothetical protein